MKKTPLRWGILGAANIAHKNWKAIWNSKTGRVAAVASRDPERTRRFIRECQAAAPFNPPPIAFDTYDELLASNEIDAVYLPLPTGVRAQWVKRAAAAGKHIVCEKPCAANVAEFREMLEACRTHGVQFMDGVMFMHSVRLERIGQVLDDGKTIGPIRRVTSAFSFLGEKQFFASNIRARSDLEPFGCLGDLGWYCIRFALWAMKWKLPRHVTGQTLSQFKHKSSKAPVPIEFSAELFFEGGVTSSFYCSFLTQIEQWATISGKLGSLHVPDFVLPFSGREIGFTTAKPAHRVLACDFEMQPHRRTWTIKEASHSAPTAQESNLFRNFARQVQGGKLNRLWPDAALKTQIVMEACYVSALEEGRPVGIS